MISYYQEGSERASKVQRLFTRIAKRYDLINDLQSLGFHRVWKRKLIQGLQLSESSRMFDLACGSGDLVFRAQTNYPGVSIIGGDYTFSMLQVARQRTEKISNRPFQWTQLDGLKLPFPNHLFDAVTMAYGLRNMADPKTCLEEIARTLKSGGILAILDFGKPRNFLLRKFYYFFLRTIQPALGWLFFQDAETYRYIYESLQKYPAQEGVTQLLVETGFEKIDCIDLALGTMSLHFARKK
jgi:demethylmenaquinone methyltransferase/2-methoxy-6-polyprenyl-1,4-benzoquinol methylase